MWNAYLGDVPSTPLLLAISPTRTDYQHWSLCAGRKERIKKEKKPDSSVWLQLVPVSLWGVGANAWGGGGGKEQGQVVIL